MPEAISDDQIRAEVQAILNADQPGDGPAPTSQGIDPTAPPPAAAPADPAAPPAAAAVPPPVVDTIDEQTRAKMQRVRDQAIAQRQQLATERQQLDGERAAFKKWNDDVARAKARGDLVALGRLHGIEPGRDHAENVLAETMGSEAPGDLKMRAQMAQLQRQADADRAELAAYRQQLDNEKQQAQQVQHQAQQHEYVKTTLLPTFGEKAAIVRALAGDAEFADGIINTGIQRYHAMAQELGEAEPAEAFAIVDQGLERLILRAMSDPAVATRIQSKLDASKPKPTTPPAEKPQPAPTTNNKQFQGSTTPPAATTDWDAYQKQVRTEVEEMLKQK